MKELCILISIPYTINKRFPTSSNILSDNELLKIILSMISSKSDSSDNPIIAFLLVKVLNKLEKLLLSLQNIAKNVLAPSLQEVSRLESFF